jgi:hypothetical protein
LSGIALTAEQRRLFVAACGQAISSKLGISSVLLIVGDLRCDFVWDLGYVVFLMIDFLVLFKVLLYNELWSRIKGLIR